MTSSTERSIWIKLADNLIIAVLYYFTARIGQMLAIPPGNISPVWIPSGIILAAMLLRGYHIWPGVLMGALVGNAWTYADTSSIGNFFISILPGLANGTGDALCVLLSTYTINRYTNLDTLFHNINYISIFILAGVFAGPFISAFFGVSALSLAGNVEAEHYWYAFITWWTGDSIGVLILTPLFLVWFTERGRKLDFTPIDIIIFGVLVFSSLFILGYFPGTSEIHIPLFALAPILIWSVFRQDIRFTYTSILIVTGLAIIATALGLGPLGSQELNVSLINLQLLIGVLTITMMYLQATVFEMQRLNTERGLLLKEIHHRVKNNLQVISGLLMLQSRTTSDSGLKMMLKESQHRINTMSLVHEMLYQSENLQLIDMQRYIRSLANYLVDSNVGTDSGTRVLISASGIQFPVDSAIPLGLLITEIVTNSLKHGIERQGNDEIYISLQEGPEEHFTLRIGDNGKGFHDTGDVTARKSLGIKLIYSLAEQLNGSLKRDMNRKGTHYKLMFSPQI